MPPSILGMRVDPTSYEEVVRLVIGWARAGECRAVYVANVHMVMEAHDERSFQEAVNRGDLVTPDGMPLVWALRGKGFRSQPRVYGPTLTLRLLAAAAEERIPVGFYGGAPQAIDLLADRMRLRFPGLQIAYAHSPPFRPLTTEEDAAVVEQIRASGARILFVGLGCPKQEQWIDAHRGRIGAVMVGVGAAFDFHADRKRQAPEWLQPLGLEWLFRLSQEPGRLWKRYLRHNPRFIALALDELLRTSRPPRSP